jgi:hypothetical protein
MTAATRGRSAAKNFITDKEWGLKNVWVARERVALTNEKTDRARDRKRGRKRDVTV